MSSFLGSPALLEESMPLAFVCCRKLQVGNSGCQLAAAACDSSPALGSKWQDCKSKDGEDDFNDMAMFWFCRDTRQRE